MSSHASLSAIIRFYPETSGYYKFGFIRNPFSRILSSFSWRKAKYLERVLHSNRDSSEIQELVADKFRQFVVSDQGRLNERGRDILFDVGMSVDRVYLLERLSQSMCELSEQLSIPGLADVDVPRFKTANIEVPDNLKLWPTDLQQYVVRRFAWEFLELDYPQTPASNA